MGGLARYASPGAVTAEPRAHAILAGVAEDATGVAYTDALGVASVTVPDERELPGAEADRRMAAWVAASTGYIAGLAEEGLRLTLEHARSRRAFGGPLSALEPVQQMLADAATLVDGLTLLTAECPGMDALAHAGDAAERAVSICMQVTGALGFTMEFPLQRAYRRSRSARSWNDSVLDAWEIPMNAALPLAGLRVLDYGQYVARRSRRCCSATSAPISSRSSRRAVTSGDATTGSSRVRAATSMR